MSAIVFMDTETTGLDPGDEVWEFAAVRREADGREATVHMFVDHDPARCALLPERFLADHRARYPGSCVSRRVSRLGGVTSRSKAAARIAALFADRPHVVGAVPDFDTTRLDRLLRDHGHTPGWNHHLICVEVLAVGWLAGRGLAVPPLPWDSDDLTWRLGVEPPPPGVRHTALGDVAWVRALYDRVMRGCPGGCNTVDGDYDETCPAHGIGGAE